MSNLTDYVAVLKLVRYTNTQNEDLKNLAFRTFLQCVQKPELFDEDLEQLLEADEHHQNLFTRLKDLEVFDFDRTDEYE